MRHNKKQADNEFDPEENPYPYIDEKQMYLLGWPGYRTHPDKSGLGYIETKAELAHIQGVLLRSSLTGKVITRNTIYLVFLFVVGLIFSSPLIPIVEGLMHGDYYVIFLLLDTGLYVVAGILILINLANSVFGESEGDSLTGD